MVGYSEVLQTIGAMVIFSLILLTATNLIKRNTYMEVAGELEKEVVALAQDIIEEARTKEFDERSQGEAPPANIPGDFTASTSLGPEGNDDTDDDANSTVQRYEFDDFDDYDGWTDTLSTEHGTFTIEADVYYVTSSPHDPTGSRTTFKELKVNIKNALLDNGSGEATVYSLSFVRNYYAD